jgi:nucleotide-binding universal stress UspA family protein
MTRSTSDGPVLFAYDGSDFAKSAIEVAGRELLGDRAAIVLTVWEPLEGIPFGGTVSAGTNEEVNRGLVEQATQVAEEGVELAKAAGFDAKSLLERGIVIWKLIVDAADQNDAAMIVLGSHGRSGVKAVLLGSVATAVASHTKRPVLIAH